MTEKTKIENTPLQDAMREVCFALFEGPTWVTISSGAAEELLRAAQLQTLKSGVDVNDINVADIPHDKSAALEAFDWLFVNYLNKRGDDTTEQCIRAIGYCNTIRAALSSPPADGDNEETDEVVVTIRQITSADFAKIKTRVVIAEGKLDPFKALFAWKAFNDAFGPLLLRMTGCTNEDGSLIEPDTLLNSAAKEK